MNKTVVIAVVNQKGGTAKTTTCENLGIGLAKEGKRVMLIDTDPQGSLTISLGYPRPDEIDVTLSDIYAKVIQDAEISPDDGIIRHVEGVDLIPANIGLAAIEVSLVGVMNRESVLKQYIEGVKDRYDYILIDCPPSLGMLTINA
ncbi:MAG: AAA family ATPase, partial [Lachnospiraceae bacterium]|nr:AAA family ATPase [Lachnospiraceae bacterium]